MLPESPDAPSSTPEPATDKNSSQTSSSILATELHSKLQDHTSSSRQPGNRPSLHRQSSVTGDEAVDSPHDHDTPPPGQQASLPSHPKSLSLSHNNILSSPVVRSIAFCAKLIPDPSIFLCRGIVKYTSDKLCESDKLLRLIARSKHNFRSNLNPLCQKKCTALLALHGYPCIELELAGYLYGRHYIMLIWWVKKANP